MICGIPDYLYYNTDYWKSETNLFGKICNCAKLTGFSYTGSLQLLKSSFGILVTAISIIISISVNILNRSEDKIFGFNRQQLEPFKKIPIFPYVRRMVLLAPIPMILSVNLGLCILGYMILILSYSFLIITYIFFASSFSQEKALDCVTKKLLESIPEEIQDSEDISNYLLMLNGMHCWNKDKQYWNGVNYLFWHIYEQTREYASQKMFTLCYCFYNIMYFRKNTENYDQAVRMLKDYITYIDIHDWEQKHYLVLWGMLHCLLRKCDDDPIVYFIKWYMNYPVRSQRVFEKCGHTIPELVMRKQIGILLIEMELYLNHHSPNEIDDNILRVLTTIWFEGKDILNSKEDTFRQEYLRISTFYDINTAEAEMRINNLRSDYLYNSSRSLLVNYIN